MCENMIWAETDYIVEGEAVLPELIDEVLPKEALKNCIAVALRYHKVKHLPFLGL